MRGSELRIDRMTWTDVQQHLARRFRTAVFAVGATEQHGPHLPIFTDTLLGTAISCGVAAELGNALVAPTVRPGYSPHHMAFPGSITLRRSTVAAIIVDYCSSLVSHGFDTIVVISSHGGNTTSVNWGVQEAQDAVGGRADIIPVTSVTNYYEADFDRYEEGYHATRIETSCVLSLTPELVHMDRARDWVNPVDRQVKERGVLWGMRGVQYFAPDGTMGKPTTASAELGAEVLSQTARNIADQLRLILSHLRDGTGARREKV
ncbi:MAG: creatininase family protein [Armatimonadota bacterium]